MSANDAMFAARAVRDQSAALLELVKASTDDLTVDEAHELVARLREAHGYLNSVRTLLTPGDVL